MGKVRIRVKIGFTRKNDIEKNIKQQSKLTSKGCHRTFIQYVRYTFKQNEVHMDEQIFLGFAVLEISKLLMYGIY